MAPPTTGNPLRELSFFAGLPDTLLWHLGKIAEKRSYAANDRLFEAGQKREIFGILISGSIAIEQQEGGKAVQIATLGAGEVIGEGVLLEEGKHGTTARAAGPVEVVCFKREPLMKLLKDQPALYAALVARAAKIINERIKRANALLLELSRKTR